MSMRDSQQPRYNSRDVHCNASENMLKMSIVRSASQKAQLVHNQEVQSVETEEVCADEMGSFVAKNRSNAQARSTTRGTVGLV